MKFSVDGWDPGYGSSLDMDDDLGESKAEVDVDVEVPGDRWRAIDPDPGHRLPAALLFVDGVRRIEARVWVDQETGNGEPARQATAALCASYAAGVVCCCRQQAHLVHAETRRGLFTIAPHATSISTWAGEYTARRTRAKAGVPVPMTLSQELQTQLGDTEVATATAARASVAGHGVAGHGAAGHGVAGHGGPAEDDLLVIDGPLRGRDHLPRALGYIKSHHSTYLPPELDALVGALRPGQRTPVFLIGPRWVRHSWYLRLPGGTGAPWSGVVRIECSADLPVPEVTRLAALSQLCLGRFASAAYKDTRAPQNLYPIAGLERELRRRMGDPRVLYRALCLAARPARRTG